MTLVWWAGYNSILHNHTYLPHFFHWCLCSKHIYYWRPHNTIPAVIELYQSTRLVSGCMWFTRNDVSLYALLWLTTFFDRVTFIVATPPVHLTVFTYHTLNVVTYNIETYPFFYISIVMSSSMTLCILGYTPAHACIIVLNDSNGISHYKAPHFSLEGWRQPPKIWAEGDTCV